MENIVSSDKAIVAARKLLLNAIRDVQEGKDPQHVVRDAKANSFPHLVSDFGSHPRVDKLEAIREQVCDRIPPKDKVSP